MPFKVEKNEKIKKKGEGRREGACSANCIC